MHLKSHREDVWMLEYGKLELTPVIRFAIARRYKRLINMAEETLDQTLYPTARAMKVIKDSQEGFTQ